MGAIERLIGQKQFASEHHKALISIIYCANSINAHNAELLKPYDITLQQYNALRILRGNKDNISTVLYIKERLLDKNSDTSRLIDRMLKSGYVDRKVCSKDRRSVDIRINQKGLKLLDDIDHVIKKEFAPLCSLTNEELTEFNKLMDKILSAIES